MCYYGIHIFVSAMEKERKIFREFLKRRNLKLTRQREEILDAFLSTDRHLTVEDLYYILRKKNPTIGHSTVFRTLKLLCESGLAREVDLGERKKYYEHKYGHQHHDHLVCVKCGKLIEVMDPEIERLQELLCKKFNFLPQRHKLDIFGICEECHLGIPKSKKAL